MTSRPMPASRADRWPSRVKVCTHCRAADTDNAATLLIGSASKVTWRDAWFSRVPWQSGHGASITPSTSASSDGKLCSRPFGSSSRFESS